MVNTGNSNEKHRLQIITQEKDELNSVTHELLELTTGDEWDYLAIKKRITTILSKIGLMSSVAKSSNYKTDPFLIIANELFKVLDVLATPWSFDSESERELKELVRRITMDATRENIGKFCNYTNMIIFDVRKQKLIFPKISLSMFKL